MTRKSGKHLRAIYETLNSCFDLIRSHQQCTPYSPPLEISSTPTREVVAPEVAESSVVNTHLQDTLGQVVTHCRHDLLIRHRLCVILTGGTVVEFRLLHTVVAGSISSGGDYGVHC